MGILPQFMSRSYPDISQLVGLSADIVSYTHRVVI